jgi:hypothetical protein
MWVLETLMQKTERQEHGNSRNTWLRPHRHKKRPATHGRAAGRVCWLSTEGPPPSVSPRSLRSFLRPEQRR